jgi:hypothetical protein
MTGFHHEAHGTGYEVVDSNISCVITRFRLRSTWSLLRFYRSYRRIRREADGLVGLLASAFLVENPRTCYTLSLWRDAGAIIEFNSLRTHIVAANQSFHELRIDSVGPQLWSAQFRLYAVSPHNLRWDGVDVTTALNQSSPAKEENRGPRNSTQEYVDAD